ncbi:MAG: hypothetical protein J5661_06020 [Bacteroidaceae bacterium]|nr:hypothetical protein [Bacteroidaceae bacterium]
MTKDKALEELFQTQKPHFDDKAAFMAKLNQRLDAVEYIKQYQDATIRRYKMAMIVAFVVGIISGGVATIFLLSMPTDAPLFSFHAQTGFFLWISENSRLIAATFLSLLMSFGIISIISNVHDIVNMHTHMMENEYAR